MKTIREGSKHEPWWEGRRVTCGNCGGQFQLEEADANLPSFKNVTNNMVVVDCPTNECNAVLRVTR